MLASQELRLICEWGAVYIERCKCGSEASIWKPATATRCGAGCLAYLDMSGTHRIYPDPVAIAHTIKDKIRDSLGFTVNVGIGDCKILAKMASDFEKPDKVHTLYRHEIPAKMWPLPVRELFSVGASTAEKLERAKIHTIGDLANTPLDRVQKIVGIKLGKQIHDYANGILDRGSQKRKRIAVISVGGMTPQIQPCVCFLKFSITNKSLRNISGDAEKPISLCGVYGTVLTLRPGTFHNPILDLVYEMLGFLIKSVSDITQLLQLLHDAQSLCTLFDPKDALQPNHPSGPHSGCHRVRMAAVDRIPLPKCCTGGKLGPIAH